MIFLEIESTPNRRFPRNKLGQVTGGGAEI